MPYIKERKELMTSQFPSIWLELERSNEKNLIIGGFYREWTRNLDNTMPTQLMNLKKFTEQIEEIAREKKPIVILGDANLCTNKWDNEDYKLKQLSNELKGTLAQGGLKIEDIGYTYLADRLTLEGKIIESALDHIYTRLENEDKACVEKLEESSTDHVPITIEIEGKEGVKKKEKIIYKRCMKNFSSENWKETLAQKAWEKIGETEDLEEMAKEFTDIVVQALDECAPVKRFKISQNYKSGLTEETKKLIKTRDNLRKEMKRSPGEKKILHERYKKLRNRITNAVRKDNINYNGDRIRRAKKDDEVWKVVNEIMKPKEDKTWILKEGEEIITDEKEIADIFNQFFINKIETLKKNIDKTQIRDPLEKLEEKVKHRGLKFTLRQVSEQKVKKVMDKMNKKKSSGLDGISQECVLMGAEILVIPLTRIINASKETGEFPTEWKKAVVTPLLKKGDAKDKNNYRPVSCLAAASKILEKIVCDQITKFMEQNKLLPESQHGFRQKRSTMTALTEIQRNWIENTEIKETTGVLFWDLSAAFDTLDTDLMIRKLKLYGCDQKTCKWFNSFLTGRSQMVKIGKTLSESCNLVSGVPQGGILSPIIFTIYCANLENWVDHSSMLNYADDTSSSCSDANEEDVMRKLKSDAEKILQFMASNGLVANPSKTEFMMLNTKGKESKRRIKVGNSEIVQTGSAKLLGVTMDDDQKWTSHFWGKNGLIPALNKRLFLIRRISNHIPAFNIKKMVDSLWTSKLRYGLQLSMRVRLSEEESKNESMKAVQIAQNKVLRMLDNSSIKDRRRISEMLTKFDCLSVNQMVAQIKLTEAWKASTDPDYPVNLGITRNEDHPSQREVRSNTRKEMKEGGRLKIIQESCTRDTGRIWNQAPRDIKDSKTIGEAKRHIKKYCKTLPV